MGHPLIRRGYQQAKKLLLIQAVILVAIATTGLFIEFKIAMALLSGGMAVFIANSFFVYMAFSRSGAQANKKVVSAFYLGETVKIILSAGLIIAAFLLLPGFEVFVLVGYVAALLSQWLAPVIIKTY